MAAASTIILTHGSEASASISAEILLDGSLRDEGLRRLIKMLESAACGARAMKVQVQVDASLVAASGTLTCASVSADDTFAIAGTTVTMKSSGASGNQVNIGGTDTLTGDAIVTFINAHTTLKTYVSASNAAGVVTVTAAQKGTLGNAVALAGTATRLAAGAAALAGGLGGTSSQSSYVHGVA